MPFHIRTKRKEFHTRNVSQLYKCVQLSYEWSLFKQLYAHILKVLEASGSPCLVLPSLGDVQLNNAVRK